MNALIRRYFFGFLTLVASPAFGQVGPTDVRAMDLLENSRGHLYSVGYIYPMTATEKWIVRKSTDKGRTWNEIHRTVNAKAFGIAVNSRGHLFVVGGGMSPGDTQGYRWTVRRSTDEGRTWKDVDRYLGADASAILAAATAIAIAPDDTIYVGGAIMITPRENLWSLRSSDDGGNSWKTLEEFRVPAKGGPSSIAFDAQGRVLVGGSTKQGWTVRASPDKGTTWNALETFVYEDSQVTGVTIGSAGEIVVTGWMDVVNRGRIWIVRASLDGGLNWLTWDSFETDQDTRLTPSRTKQVTSQSGVSKWVTVGQYLKLKNGGSRGIVRHASSSAPSLWETQTIIEDSDLMGIFVGKKSAFLFGTAKLMIDVSGHFTTWMGPLSVGEWKVADDFTAPR